MSNQAYRLGLKQVGSDVTIWPLAKIVSPEVISIGNSVIIDDFVFIVGGRKTEIGNFVHIASFTSITGGGVFKLEDFSGCASGCRFSTGTEDFLGGSMTGAAVPYPYRVAKRSFIHIKKYVEIGMNTVVLPGVTIGEGVAIGANSLILKDCEPWTVYVGSPARPLKARPSEKILELERQLRSKLYDANGHYIPKALRENERDG
jgi:galactoside O-acetyltransferase